MATSSSCGGISVTCLFGPPEAADKSDAAFPMSERSWFPALLEGEIDCVDEEAVVERIPEAIRGWACEEEEVS
jgi:hypothetical protein